MAIVHHHWYGKLWKTSRRRSWIGSRYRCHPVRTASREGNCSHNKMSITDVLKPLWVLTFAIGIFLDWCCPIERRFASITANRIGIVINGLILFLIAIFNLINTCYSLNQVAHKQFLISLLWSVGYLAVTAFFLIFCNQHTKLKGFFEDFSQMEMKLLTGNGFSLNIRPTRYLVAVGLIRAVITVICAVITTLQFGGCNCITNSKLLRDMFPVQLLRSVHIISLFQMFIIHCVCEIVPPLIFFYTSLVVKHLENKTMEKLTVLDDEYSLKIFFVQLRAQFDDIRRLVDQANNTFGLLMALNHGSVFFIVCILSYLFQKTLSSADLPESMCYFTSLVLFVVLSLIMKPLITGQVERASQSLSLSLSSFSSHNWNRLNQQEQETVLIVTKKCQDFSLRVRPMDMYSVNRSFILTQLSFILTYTVILFQSV